MRNSTFLILLGCVIILFLCVPIECDFQPKDLYKVLGLNKESNPNPAQIKKAYRNLARRWHPDKRPNDPRAADKMADINKAYEILSDPKKKEHYDMFGVEEGQPHQPNSQHGNPFSHFTGGSGGSAGFKPNQNQNRQQSNSNFYGNAQTFSDFRNFFGQQHQQKNPKSGNKKDATGGGAKHVDPFQTFSTSFFGGAGGDHGDPFGDVFGNLFGGGGGAEQHGGASAASHKPQGNSKNTNTAKPKATTHGGGTAKSAPAGGSSKNKTPKTSTATHAHKVKQRQKQQRQEERKKTTTRTTQKTKGRSAL